MRSWLAGSVSGDEKSSRYNVVIVLDNATSPELLTPLKANLPSPVRRGEISEETSLEKAI